jgi:hypothetical protein
MYRLRRPALGFGAAALAIQMVLALSSARGTPPEPPASLLVKPALREGRLDKGRGKLAWDVSIRARQVIGKLSVEVFVHPVKAGLPAPTDRKAAFRKEWEKYAPEGKALTVEIDIPGPGQFEVDLRLKGDIAKGNGFSDRQLWLVTVEQDGSYRVATPSESMTEGNRKRVARFEQALREKPEHPPVRLLADETVKVPGEITRTMKPLV